MVTFLKVLTQMSAPLVKGKIVFVGDTSVGKTALINSYNKLSINAKPTIGANSVACNVDYNGKNVVLNVWDTAGQEDFRCLVPVYARCAQVAVIVFDLTNQSSYDSVSEWVRYLKEEVQVPNLLLVGNKDDLNGVVNFNIAMQYAQSQNLSCIKTSALTGSGVEELFSEIAQFVEEPSVKPEVEQVSFKPVAIHDNQHQTSGKGCC